MRRALLAGGAVALVAAGAIGLWWWQGPPAGGSGDPGRTPARAQPKPKPKPKPKPDTTRRPGAQIPTHAVDGSPVDWKVLREKAVMVAFVSPRMTGLVECLTAYQAIYAERRQANLNLVVVSIDPGSGPGLRALAEDKGFEFPIVVDEGNAMQAAYRPSAIPHAFFFVEQGKYNGALPGFPESGSPSPGAFYANLLRRATGLEPKLDNDPSNMPWPDLPAFAIPGTEISRDSLRGRPYLLAFVASDCDRCKEQLLFYRTLHQEFAGTGLEFVVVLVSDHANAEKFRKERELPFPVYADPTGDLRHTLRYRGFVPDTLVVDQQGRIRYRHTAFDQEHPPLYRMELRRILGQDNPPILKPNGPSGVRRCMVCHEREYFDWKSTGHARAMRTLQAIGSADKADCVRCHVVGWDQPGGFNADRGARAQLLVDVQCESCHQNGGPHLPDAVRQPITAATCVPCHDKKHSLNFDFHKFVGLVNHSEDVFGVSAEQRQRILAERQRQRAALLEPDGAHVGAGACRECHQAQYQQWQSSAHARALRHLQGAQRQDRSCLRCHTTGFERQWTPPAPKAPGRDDSRAAQVQCESCHGPGQAHTQAKGQAALRETIIGLGERCPECVVRQICTGCHDLKNDPDFDLHKALDVIRPLCKGAGSTGGR